jgi:hypothetical protein
MWMHRASEYIMQILKIERENTFVLSLASGRGVTGFIMTH